MKSNPMIDLEAARRLVGEMAASLEGLPAGSAGHGELRAEVSALQAVLGVQDEAHPALPERMGSLRDALGRAANELQADGIRAGLYLTELGRILGLE